ncbi:MAG: hypothetical protein JSW73_02780 [Candidatus Woesearchaeota archaeon]|nr:MAG: hypothetical protein JSW73_02780 [Candidatus Woesearchaeota archaeon]
MREDYPSGGDVSIGDSKPRKYFKIILFVLSILGILSGLAIILLATGANLPIEISMETLATIAAVSAVICGLYTLVGLIKKRREF